MYRSQAGFSSNVMRKWYLEHLHGALLTFVWLNDGHPPLLLDLVMPNLQEFTLASHDPCPADIMCKFLRRHPMITSLTISWELMAGSDILDVSAILPTLRYLTVEQSWIPILLSQTSAYPNFRIFSWNISSGKVSTVRESQHLLRHIVALHQNITFWLLLWHFISMPEWFQIAEPRAETSMGNVKELYLPYPFLKNPSIISARLPAALGFCPALQKVNIYWTVESVGSPNL